MVELLGGVAFATAEAWEALREEAIFASLALVLSKPSGYVKILLPSSPGSPNGGCTGFKDKFPLPQLPTQNEETSDMSIQIPLHGILL